MKTFFIFAKLTASLAAQDSILEVENGLRPNGSKAKFHLLDRMGHYHILGVSIAVVNDGKIAWAKGYGHVGTAQRAGRSMSIPLFKPHLSASPS